MCGCNESVSTTRPLEEHGIGRRTSLGRCEFSVSYCGKSELGSVWSSSIIEESRFSFLFSSRKPFLGETSIFKKLAILRLFRNCFASMKLNRREKMCIYIYTHTYDVDLLKSYRCHGNETRVENWISSVEHRTEIVFSTVNGVEVKFYRDQAPLESRDSSKDRCTIDCDPGGK